MQGLGETNEQIRLSSLRASQEIVERHLEGDERKLVVSCLLRRVVNVRKRWLDAEANRAVP